MEWSVVAGTLTYRLRVDHVFQRRFDQGEPAKALQRSHWYLIVRRPAVRLRDGGRRTPQRCWFRLIQVHLSGWWGWARFCSDAVPTPYRGHLICKGLSATAPG